MSITKNTAVIAGDADWRADLGPIITGLVVNDGGVVERNPRVGQAGVDAVPIKHQCSMTFDRMFEGDTARILAAHPTGYVFAIATDVDGWEGGAYADPSDNLTNPTGGLMIRGANLAQAGPWHDAGPASAKDRRLAVALTASSPTLTSIAYDPGTDSVFLVLTTGAVASVQLSQGGNTNTSVATSVAGGVLVLDNANLGDTPLANVVLTATGLTGDETLVGWLLTGAPQGLD